MFEDAVLESIRRLKPDIGEEELRDLFVETSGETAKAVVESLHEATPAMRAVLRLGLRAVRRG